MKKRIISLLLVLLLALAAFAGCQPQPIETAEPAPAQEAPAAAPAAPEEPAAQPEAGTRIITDMAGREVTIPAEIDAVYCAVPTGEAMVATLLQEKLVGWVNKPTEDNMKYLNDTLANLPVIGGWMGQKVTANMEDIIKLAPDVVIYMGTITLSTGSSVEEIPDQIQDQTGIPVIAVSSEFKDTPYVYRFLGECLGIPERGEQLASYCEEKMAAIKAATENIPENERVRVYYAEGEGGLATDPSGSGHTEVLDFINVVNVADVEMLGGQGMTEVSIEQVINWNPDAILISGYTTINMEEIKTNPIWSDIKAVQDGRIYITPVSPFNWFDRPPNIMRILGIQWFASVMYPEYVDIDINKEIKEFYSLFYDVALTDADVASLLIGNPEQEAS